MCVSIFFFFSSRRRHTRCALVTGVQTCALPISEQVVISSPPGATCTTDADLLTRALGLLVDNAIKYGGIAAVEATQHDGGWTFVVRDSGAGFPVEIGRASCRERVCQYV